MYVDLHVKYSVLDFNLLKPTGHVMHQQFNTWRKGSFKLFKRSFSGVFLKLF
jgi:hypothetical protein